jgi:transcriptional regulator with PAS, ATPase and Fis domain
MTPAAAPQPEAGVALKDLVREFEIRAIENSVADHGSKRSAAKALGIDVATLIRKTNRSRDAQPTRSEDT